MPPEKTEMSGEIEFPLRVPLPESWDGAVAALKNDLYRCGRSESTVITCASALKAFAFFYRDHLKRHGPHVAFMLETDVQAFVNFLRYDRHLTATSVNGHIAAIRAFPGFLLEKGWHRRLVARSI